MAGGEGSGFDALFGVGAEKSISFWDFGFSKAMYWYDRPSFWIVFSIYSWRSGLDCHVYDEQIRLNGSVGVLLYPLQILGPWCPGTKKNASRSGDGTSHLRVSLASQALSTMTFTRLLDLAPSTIPICRKACHF